MIDVLNAEVFTKEQRLLWFSWYGFSLSCTGVSEIYCSPKLG